MLATSAGEANRLMSEVGRTFSKNSFSNASDDLLSVLASASTNSSTPRDFVGPGSTLLTVIPVPATASASPRETASCAAARLQRFAPAGRTQAPAVAGTQAGKAELGHRRRKIIAAGFGELEKRGGHDGADRV